MEELNKHMINMVFQNPWETTDYSTNGVGRTD